jgi:hypothetical protein
MKNSIVSSASAFALALAAAFSVAPLTAQNATAPAPAAPASAVAQKTSLGVVPVKVTDPVKTNAARAGRANELAAFAKILETRLSGVLAADRKFKVVTRADLDTVLKEQDIGASGNVDTADSQLARRFKLAGVATVLQVTVTDFQDRVRTLRSEALDQTLVRRDIRVLVSAALLDTSTGVIRESIVIEPITQGDLDKKITGVRDTAEAGDQVAAELAIVAAGRISARLNDVLFPARILSHTGENVLINRGDTTGIAVGQEWLVYALGEELIDPDTGEKLGANEVEIGRVVVTEVLAKFSRARVLKDQGKGIAKGQILRLVKAPAK